MIDFDSKPRPRKMASYNHLYGGLVGQTVSSAFMMPSGACNDIKFLKRAGIIRPEVTTLIVAERCKWISIRMLNTLGKLGWHRGKNLIDYCCPLNQIAILPKKIGIVSIDLLGSLSLMDAQWMADVMMPALAPSSVAAVTVSSAARNNVYITEFWNAVSAHYPQIVEDFVSRRTMDRVIYQRPALWLKVIFHRFDFALRTYAYNDSDSPGSEMLAMRLDSFERRSHPERFLSQAFVEQITNLDRDFRPYRLRTASKVLKAEPS